MNTTEAHRSISDEDFDIISDACWEQIALFAFEKYKENGRGAVFLDRQGLSENVLQDQVNLGYAVYTLKMNHFEKTSQVLTESQQCASNRLPVG